MRRFTSWIWRKGIVSTFMTGFFVLLPIMITGWRIVRAEGAILLTAYTGYITSLTIRL